MLEKPTYSVDKTNKLIYTEIVIKRRKKAMKTLYERIKKARMDLHLSQEYVAKMIGVSRTAIVEIESDRRKVSAEELRKFSELFQISSDELLNDSHDEMPVQMFARKFGSLDESDQKEILNLIEFKRRMKERV